MTWHSEFLGPGAAGIELEERHPYLSSLLSAAPAHLPLTLSRVANWRTAREAERNRPPRVGNMPYHVVLDPATICNLRCPLCVQATAPSGRKRGFLHLADYERVLAEIAPTAIRLDLFNWGEPLLNPAFSEIVQRAHAHSLWTRTSSNLSLATGFDADQLVRSGLRYLVVSIDGSTQETYEQYRVRGDLDLVLRNVEAVVAAKERHGTTYPTVEWQFLALDHNTHEIEAARSVARGLGVDVFRYGGARAEMSTKLTSSSAEGVAASAPYLLAPTHPLSEYDERGAKLRTRELEGCRWLWGKAALNPDGGVAPCLSSWFDADDLGTWTGEGGFTAVWKGESFDEARRVAVTSGTASGSVCSQCAHHRNFVPTPDNDREEWPDAALVTSVAAGLRASGTAVAAEVEDGVRGAVETVDLPIG